ncbi:hypothetical protein NA57DRAFT_79385 [Rhizodiscina lignyota]|uniref:Uncharacterized protein n=1 Tax=Rhizodiscina lignyota TaxID=1504668 RepID=A0A9P4IBT4_9PEZI|nr:hypothetical protein NA57DRAFT_79385 [Rhizodiscina lignyota]
MANDSDATPQASLKEKDKDGKKRRFFGLGKRKESSEKTPTKSSTSTSTPTTVTSPSNKDTAQPLEIPRPAPRSPPTGAQSSLSAAASPARSSRYRSSSPRLHSPASSLIFERNVQDDRIPDDMSANIPSHIQTEDYIPAVLEASSLAITDEHLNPDEVEIVMHAAHQPAAEKVHVASGAGTLTPGASDTSAISPIQGLSPIEDFGMNLHQSLESTQNSVANQFAPPGDDANSSYGGYDTHDVRRLSFISFADVVQSEHVESSRDSVMHMSLSLSGSTANRSPSPVRSPASSHGVGGGTSPPTSGAPSMKGLDIGAATTSGKGTGAGAGMRVTSGSPTTVPHSPRTEGGGEIVVETMRQALQHTESGDLVPKSAVERGEGEESHVFR